LERVLQLEKDLLKILSLAILDYSHAFKWADTAPLHFYVNANRE
jgi:hypothetical protein